MKRFPALFFLSLALVFCLFSCTRNDLKIETYQTEKQPVVSNESMTQQMMSPQGGMPEQVSAPASQEPSAYGWDIPKGWGSEPGSSMRLVSFKADGHTGSIIVLEGEAGGLVANVNRWREQVGLPAQDEAAVLKAARKGKSALGEFRWFEIVNDSSPGQSMLVAVVPADGKTLFVKLMAPKAALQKNQEKFLSLCRSLRRA
ncbi:MAG: hypothetical protein NDJ89_01130 [Oligoflexia bacterium]|nr:hypothetical protein [Oligoflexia bacterium]